MVHATALCYRPETVSASADKGISTETWGLESGSRERTAVGCMEGTGVRSCTAKDAHGGNPDQHRNEAPFLSDV